MLCSIPWNKYEDNTIKLDNELLGLNNKFDKALSFGDLLTIQEDLTEIHKELFVIQTALRNEKKIIKNSEFEKYQKYLDNAFKRYFLIEKKLINAKKHFTSLAKNGTISTTNDAI